jgi:membrane protease YdiL (CAAX protease family)
MKEKEILSIWILPALMVLALLVWTFGDILLGLYDQWMNNEDYSHGLLILPVSLFLVWEKRKEILALTPRQTGGDCWS